MIMKITFRLFNGIKNKIIMGFAVIMSFLMTTTSVFAANPLEEAGLLGSNGPLNVFYNFATSIGVPIAVLGIAFCFVSFFMTNERGAAVAKKSMFYIGLAVAVLMLIPNIYKVFATGPLRNMAWNPTDANRPVLIANADTRDTYMPNIDIENTVSIEIPQSWGADNSGQLPTQNTFG